MFFFFFFAANFAPNITNSASAINVTVGDEVEIIINAIDMDGDDISYSLYKDLPNATITRVNNNGRCMGLAWFCLICCLM